MQATHELTEEMVGALYRNNKKGTVYVVTGLSSDCTSGSEGHIIVAYTDGNLSFSRELDEFREKFVKIGHCEVESFSNGLTDMFESLRRNTIIFARRKIAYYIESDADVGQRNPVSKEGKDIPSGRVPAETETNKCHLRLVSTTES